MFKETTKSEHAFQTVFNLGGDEKLISLKISDAASLFGLIKSDRERLSKWLPWVNDTNEVKDVRNFINNCIEDFKKGSGIHYGIYSKQNICGVISLHINPKNKSSSVGLWIGKKYEGKGLATRSVANLSSYGLKYLDLSRIEFAAATENHQSRALAERLHFIFEGVLRCREKLTDRTVDHAVYSLIAGEKPVLKTKIR